MATQAALELVVRMKDEAARAGLEQMQAKLRGLDDVAGQLSGGLNALVAGAGIAGFVALAQQVGTVAVEFSRMAEEGAQIDTRLRSEAGGADQAAAAMAAMGDAVGFALDKDEQALTATTALTQGMATTGSQAAQLAEAAIYLGEAQQTAAERVNSLMRALTTGRAAALAGYMVDLDELKARTTELTDANEGMTDSQALTQAFLETSRESVQKLKDENYQAVTSIDRLAKAWREWKDTAAEKAAPETGGVVNFVTGQIEFMNKFGLGGWGEVFRLLGERARGAVDDVRTLWYAIVAPGATSGMGPLNMKQQWMAPWDDVLQKIAETSKAWQGAAGEIAATPARPKIDKAQVAELTAELRKFEQDAKRLQELAVDYAKRSTEAALEYERESFERRRDMQRQLTQMAEQHARTLEDLTRRQNESLRDADERRSELAEDLTEKLSDLEEGHNERRKDLADNLTAVDQDHATRRKEIEDQVRYAASEADRLEALERLRREDERYAKERAAAEQKIRDEDERYARERAKAEEQNQDQLDRLQRQQERELAEIERRLTEEQADYQAALAERYRLFDEEEQRYKDQQQRMLDALRARLEEERQLLALYGGGGGSSGGGDGGLLTPYGGVLPGGGTQNYILNISTSASVEPIAADFALLRARAGR